jgi:hypothetical protein
MRRRLLATLLSLLLLAACSGSGSSDDGASSSGAAPVASDAATGAESAGEADGDAITAVPTGAPLTAGRSIIATATASVSVDDVEVAARRAVELATAAGGFLAGQQSRLEEREVHVTLRVPSVRFHQVLADVNDLGEVVQADVTTQDVTEVVVDLQSRISSARASVDRLRGLLERAGDVAQLAAVEGELARREAEMESLLGRLRVLDDRVDLSTLDVGFTEPAPPARSDGVPGFVEALRTGWTVFVDVGRVASAGVGYALPFAALVLVVGTGVVVIRRRGTGVGARHPD